MSAALNVLVVGSGIAGSALALRLAQGGVPVEIVDADPGDSQHGSSTNIQGNGLVVLERLGVLGAVLDAGAAFDSIGLRSADGTLLGSREDLRSGGPGVPSNLGIDTARLRELLLTAATEAGASCHAVVDATSRRPGTVVVAADGPRSAVRAELGLAPAVENGMFLTSSAIARTPGLAGAELTFDGPELIRGVFPTGPTTACAWQVTTVATPDARPVLTHRGALEWYGVDTVLIGDAVHAVPPNLPQGPALALEDAWTLAELLLSGASTAEVGPELARRRSDRVSTLLAAAQQLAGWLVDGVRGDVPSVMGSVARELTARA